METKFDINGYLDQGIRKLIGNIIKAAFSNPRAAVYMLNMQRTVASAQKRRDKYESEGIHVPAFLISSITEKCNLFCQGCYARSNGICGTEETKKQALSPAEWERIFAEAVDMGIPFSIIAGGEPLLRRDVIKVAAEQKNMIFGIFTNGTIINRDYTELFAKNPNLVPIISMEGFGEETDKRRGNGVYEKLTSVMRQLDAGKILYGVSVTVTSENMRTVTSARFIDNLRGSGCKSVFFVEYVPVENGTEHLALSEADKDELDGIIFKIKVDYPDMIFFSFPGDEKHMGGCLAAGRGFFHINPQGEAEACPFSPYSDRNLRQHSLREVLRSPFFEKLRRAELVGGEHTGGCVLFERELEVKKMLGL